MPDPSTQNRDNFPYLISVPTRLSDNDMLGHVNNVIYYRYIEAVVVRFQMEEAGVDWLKDKISPQAVETRCRFHHPLSFPETVDAGLRVERIRRRPRRPPAISSMCSWKPRRSSPKQSLSPCARSSKNFANRKPAPLGTSKRGVSPEARG